MARSPLIFLTTRDETAMTPESSDHSGQQNRQGIELRDSPELVSPKGHYSHVALHGGVAYISGQLPVDPSGTLLAAQPFDVQARQALTNLDHCLRTAGSSRDRLLSVQVFVADMGNWPDFDAAYAQWVGTHRPARVVAWSRDLHFGAALEVSAIAAVD